MSCVYPAVIQYPTVQTPSAPLPPSSGLMYNDVPSYNTLNTVEERMQKFAALAGRYEINANFASRLRQLEGYEIVFLCDDSGSMATGVGNPANAFGVRLTRWDELKQIVSIIVDFASVLDPDGIDIYFLNRPPLSKVNDSSQLAVAFAHPPNGLTPISRVLRQILQEKRSVVQERKLLIIIATDGEPTDDYGIIDIDILERILKTERKPADRIPITFCACTEDDQAVEYLNKWDKKIPFVDVCDDYRTEREQIQRVQGPHFPFSFGDYVIKILLGSVDAYFDNLDQRKIGTTNQHACCSIM